jgi:hypothetical protein
LIKGCRYAELFYTYRNNLIHEFRAPGYGIEVASDTARPYHRGLQDDGWQLVFPAGFFAFIFASALSGLESYLMARDQDGDVKALGEYFETSCERRNRQANGEPG